ncbi:MAG TPA: bifunctional enoyl-CoA hydratase/phosphate acetyltransferase [Parvularculaceae bacterium]|nr:bifunctional enoyl-CoA hydratase/phosphate acetyltransferase [Parvularculaceae bacterium]
MAFGQKGGSAPMDMPKRTVEFESGLRLKALIASAKAFAPIKTAVVHPVEPVSLSGAVEAAREGLIIPVLVGPRARIEGAAKTGGIDISKFELVDAPHSHAAAARAVALAHDGAVDALMKGALHTDEIMHEVVSFKSGLLTERRISHVYVMDAPGYEKLLFITDAAINIQPDLEVKRDIVQNAIDLARALGIEAPKVAILSAVETVYPKIQSTIDAAALCKMADRGQIKGGVLDGPLAIDNAVSPEAAATKGIVSPVAGHADILVAPDIDAGNILAKQLDYLAGAVAAGVVLGARVPIVLTSRAEETFPRVASCAVAQIFHHRRAETAA